MIIIVLPLSAAEPIPNEFSLDFVSCHNDDNVIDNQFHVGPYKQLR